MAPDTADATWESKCNINRAVFRAEDVSEAARGFTNPSGTETTGSRRESKAANRETAENFSIVCQADVRANRRSFAAEIELGMTATSSASISQLATEVISSSSTAET